MPDAHGKASKSITGCTRKSCARGGQPGNQNALRHGFYSRLWTIRTGNELGESNIEDELALSRFKARLLAILTPLKHPDEHELKLYDRLVATVISINTLERTRLLTRGHGGAIADEIWKAIMELNPDEEL